MKPSRNILSLGINGSLRRREVHSPTLYTEYCLFNSQANLKAYSHNGLDFAYYGYNAANTRTYKLSMLNMHQWTNGQPEPLSLQLQQAMFYPNAYINFNQNGEYTKHYYNGAERIASRLGDNSVGVSASCNDRFGFRTMQADGRARAELQELVSAGDVPVETPSMDVSDLLPIGNPDDIFYYHTNHLGSTAFVTDQNQTVTQGFLYAPFGEITTEYNATFGNDVIPKYSFNAKELDEETGMYYYEARYYKPPVFTSRDAMFEKYFWMSPYAYCANNPVKYVDPDGREKIIYYDTKTKNSAENSANQRRKENAESYNDNPNVVNVFAHGVSAEIPEDVFFRGNISADFLGLALPKNNNLSSPLNGYAKPAQEMYDFIKANSTVFQNNENNGKGSVIILHSCNSGKGDNSFAQQMSQSDNFKGSVIIAPSDILSSERVNDKYKKKYVNNNGCWNVYYNGKKISTIDGKANLELLQNILKDENAVQKYIKACSNYE